MFINQVISQENILRQCHFTSAPKAGFVGYNRLHVHIVAAS